LHYKVIVNDKVMGFNLDNNIIVMQVNQGILRRSGYTAFSNLYLSSLAAYFVH